MCTVGIHVQPARVDFPRNMRTANKPVSQMLGADSFHLGFFILRGEEPERWQAHFIFSHRQDTEIMGRHSTGDVFTCTRCGRQSSRPPAALSKGVSGLQFVGSCSPWASALQASLCCHADVSSFFRQSYICGLSGSNSMSCFGKVSPEGHSQRLDLYVAHCIIRRRC